MIQAVGFSRAAAVFVAAFASRDDRCDQDRRAERPRALGHTRPVSNRVRLCGVMSHSAEPSSTIPESGRARSADPRLEVAAVTKRFPGALALEDVSLEVMPGEVLAVIGENGAGKSTLMKILAGILAPDQGVLRLNRQPVQFASPGDAIDAGVSLIHQELNLHENLSVAENIYLGREPQRFGWIDRAAMNRQAAEHLQRLGLDIAPQTPLASLSTASRQLVEVAKALSADASVVIMDEPTSSLSTREAERLFEVVEGLAAEGVSVVYISHRLGEVVRLARRVEVLRDGRNAGRLVGEQIHHDAMVSAMVGRDVRHVFGRSSVVAGEVRLEVDSLRVESHSAPPVSFQVRAGEVVGVAGLVGAGRSELLETIFGIRSAAEGHVRVAGRRVHSGRVREAMSAGLALVPEDRKRTGLLLDSSVGENATLAVMADAKTAPWLDRRWQRSTSDELIRRLSVKTASAETTLANLSGGNQQKVALGKWLVREPAVLMLDEPTRGVDVGAKQEIYRLLDQLAQEGLAILFVSSEMEEVLSLADRVLVMHQGRIAGELAQDELSEEAIMRLAVGLNPTQAAQPPSGLPAGEPQADR